MSDASPEDRPSSNDQPERRGPPPNPIHHPLFLPVLLVAYTLWFGYDAFINTDHEHLTFNRIGYILMQPFCLRAVPRGISEFLEDQQIAARAQDAGKVA